MNDITLFNQDGRILASSREVAEKFSKQNKHVNETIRKLMAENSTVKSMFLETTYMSDRGRREIEFLMDRDGFSLLVMGFTGKKALEWKLKYIDAFNNMEETLKSDLSEATEEELMGVCKDFEAYFIEQMFKAMQRMVPESEDNTSASTKQLRDYYKEQMNQSFAEQASENGGLGIAQVLYEQMKRNYGME